MQKTKAGLSRDRHVAIGAQLYETLASLRSIHVELAAAYQKGSSIAAYAESAVSGVDALRCELDNALADDATQEEWDSQRLDRVYYPERPSDDE